jgi:WD40 repeat protein
VWDWNGSVVSRITGHTDEVNCLQFDDGVLVTGSDDKSVRMFDMRTSKQVMTMMGHRKYVRCVFFRGIRA